MKQAVLGIGSNLGNREENIALAISKIEEIPKTKILKLSNIYQTEPFDVISEQDDYLNCCVLIETNLTPQELLAECFKIETSLHRERKEYHGARTMDIDLLLFEDFSSADKNLTIPHKAIKERAFVMVPLSDIFPTLTALGFNFEEAFKSIDKLCVQLYK